MVNPMNNETTYWCQRVRLFFRFPQSSDSATTHRFLGTARLPQGLSVHSAFTGKKMTKSIDKSKFSKTRKQRNFIICSNFVWVIDEMFDDFCTTKICIVTKTLWQLDWGRQGFNDLSSTVHHSDDAHVDISFWIEVQHENKDNVRPWKCMSTYDIVFESASIHALTVFWSE